MDYKQVIVIRRKFLDDKGKEFSMRLGKSIAQGSHASQAAVFNTGWFVDKNGQPTKNYEDAIGLYIPLTDHTKGWLAGVIDMPPRGFKKIVVGVESEQELQDIYNKALAANIPCSIIQDSGLTEFKGVPTFTAVSVGPAEASLIDPITSHLKLL